MPATRTEQPFWQRFIEPHRDRPGSRVTTRFLDGRTKFGKPGDPEGEEAGSPPFGCVLVTWRRRAPAAEGSSEDPKDRPAIASGKGARWTFSWLQRSPSHPLAHAFAIHADGIPRDFVSACGGWRPSVGERSGSVQVTDVSETKFCANCRKNVDADVRDRGAADPLGVVMAVEPDVIALSAFRRNLQADGFKVKTRPGETAVEISCAKKSCQSFGMKWTEKLTAHLDVPGAVAARIAKDHPHSKKKEKRNGKAG
jgi:hypothetical protein